MKVRLAVVSDIAAVKIIADRERNILGFVNSTALVESVGRDQLYVAVTDNNEVVGFANCWRRMDGWHTIQELCVSFSHRANGAGRALIATIPKPIRLKCLAGNDQANQFYRHLGFVVVATIPASDKKRELYLWHLT